MKKVFLASLIFIFSINFLIAQNPIIQVSPASITITPNQVASYHVDISNPGAFNQQLFFNIDNTNLPGGFYSFSFNANPVNYPYSSGTDLTIQTNGSIATGNYYVVISASNGPVITYDTCELQMISPQCYWTSYQLPGNMPPGYSMTIDSVGMKWIVGYNKVIKYNGTSFTSFDTSNSNYPNGAEIVGEIAVDHSNGIWMATRRHGLVSFDGTFWTHYNTSNSFIPSDSLYAVVIDGMNNKWIATHDSGIVKFDGITWTSYNSTNAPIPDNCIKKLSIDKLGVLWMVGYPNPSSNTATFLAKYDGSNWVFYDFLNSCFNFNCTLSVLKFDQNNNLWFCAGMPSATCSGPSSNNGLIKFDGSNWEVWMDSAATPYNHYIRNSSCVITFQDNQSKLPVRYMREIFITPDNIVWIANGATLPGIGEGLTKFDGINWETFTPLNSYLPKKSIKGINYRNDTIWVISSPDFYGGSTPNYLANYYCDNLTSVQNDELTNNVVVNVIPNPFSENATISLSHELMAGKLELFNVTGNKVRTINFTGNRLDLFQSNLSSGMYFYIIKDGDVNIISGKVCIQ